MLKVDQHKGLTMWHREYRDYKTDEPLVQQQVHSGQIIGCEMHEINGWGNTKQHPKKKKRGLIASLLIHLFGGYEKDEHS